MANNAGTKGFTLVELLVILGITSILISGTILGYNSILTNNALYDASNKFLNLAGKANEESKQNLNNTTHGLLIDVQQFKPNEIVYFDGDSYLTSTTSQIFSISDRLRFSIVRFYNSTAPYSSEVYFNQGTGLPNYKNGLIRIESKSDPSKYIELIMNSEGRWIQEKHY